MSIEAKVRALTGLGAGWVMWVLLGLSVVVLAIAVERALFLLSRSDDVPALRRSLASALARGDLEAARGLVHASKAIEARVLAAGLGAAARGPSAVRERLASEAQMTRLSLERRLAILGTVGSNAPFVGLLGTVIGIIRAFHALDAAGGQVSTALMAEIGEALGATALGLLVALPAVALFNVFQRTIATRIARAEALGRELMSFVKVEQDVAEGAGE